MVTGRSNLQHQQQQQQQSDRQAFTRPQRRGSSDFAAERTPAAGIRGTTSKAIRHSHGLHLMPLLTCSSILSQMTPAPPASQTQQSGMTWDIHACHLTSCRLQDCTYRAEHSFKLTTSRCLTRHPHMKATCNDSRAVDRNSYIMIMIKQSAYTASQAMLWLIRVASTMHVPVTSITSYTPSSSSELAKNLVAAGHHMTGEKRPDRDLFTAPQRRQPFAPHVHSAQRHAELLRHSRGRVAPAASRQQGIPSFLMGARGPCAQAPAAHQSVARPVAVW